MRRVTRRRLRDTCVVSNAQRRAPLEYGILVLVCFFSQCDLGWDWPPGRSKTNMNQPEQAASRDQDAQNSA